MARASAAIGRNTAYLQQYLTRGMPKVLSSQDTVTLSRLLGCDASELQHETRRAPAPRTGSKYVRRRPSAVVSIPEIIVTRDTHPDTVAGPSDPHDASWRIPDPILLHERHADPAHVRILQLEDHVMMPELYPGDRIVLDTSRPWPSLWS